MNLSGESLSRGVRVAHQEKAGPGEGYHTKKVFIRYPSPAASRHPLPSGEGFGPDIFYRLQSKS